MDKMEEEGLKNVLKYFDRIHDKLFTFNNILIAGYFALSKIENSMSSNFILIPLFNLGFLLYIEARMIEKSRFEPNIKKKSSSDIDQFGKRVNNTNRLSLLALASTLFVTCFFLVNLFF